MRDVTDGGAFLCKQYSGRGWRPTDVDEAGARKWVRLPRESM